MNRRPYVGLVEALTLEEAALRCRLGAEAFKRHYTGPITRIGGARRITAKDLDRWLDTCRGGAQNSASEDWDGVGDAQNSNVQERKTG